MEIANLKDTRWRDGWTVPGHAALAI